MGSLRGFTSAMALHALTPALSRHWRCPGCGHRLLGTHAQVQEHLAGCAKALQLPREVVDSCGYEGGAGGGGGGTGASGAGSRDVQEDGRKAGAADGPAGEQAGEGAAAREVGSEVQQAGLGGEAAVEAGAGPGEGASGGAAAELPDAQRQFTDRLTWAGLRGQITELTAKAGAVRWGRRVPGVSGASRARAAGGTAAGAGATAEEQRGQVDRVTEHELDVLQVLEGALGPAARGPEGVAGVDGVCAGDVGGGAAGAGGPVRQWFECPECGLQAQLTAVEVLQHKRSHR